MKTKTIVILICTLFFLSAISGAVDTITKTNNDRNNNYKKQLLTTPTTTVWLKFFVHDECNKNISQMVADCNDIFDGEGSASRNGGITQFGTNGTTVTLSDSDLKI